MQNDENNAGEVATNLEPEVETTEVATETPGDPFDSIEDERLRAEAKRFRAIANRHKSDKPAEESKPEKVAVPQASAYVTKNDMAIMATREAKELVPKEVLAEYEELVKIPLGGFDPLDPKSIAANLVERFALLQKRKSPEKDDSASDLTSTTVVNGSGVRKEVKPDQKEPPNFFIPKGPDTWYPKKES